jgi:hypothetical protein
MTGHGFRGLASTILHEQGYTHDHIELQLAHAPRNAVSAAYNHALYLEPRARMMQNWADFLEQAQRGGKVLPFPESAGYISPFRAALSPKSGCLRSVQMNQPSGSTVFDYLEYGIALAAPSV